MCLYRTKWTLDGLNNGSQVNRSDWHGKRLLRNPLSGRKQKEDSGLMYIFCHLPKQCTAGVSSNRLRQTVQNFLLWWVGSDQQWATGFCAEWNDTWQLYSFVLNCECELHRRLRTFIIHGAMPEQGVTTLLTHRSWMIKLQTESGGEMWLCNVLAKVQKLFQWDHNVECLSKGNWLVWHFVYVISFDIKKIWKNCVYVISQDLVFIHLNVYKIRLQINHPFI